METEQFHSHIHEHPLTLLAEDYFGDFTCPSCGQAFLDKSYRCRRCENRVAEGCFACEGKISGSCYVCKQCWPKSHFFHKSCVDELPQKLKIAFRPQCLFHLEEEYSSSLDVLSFRREIEFECDFCRNKSRKGYRYCCYLCNFRVDARCAAYLNKYHKAGQEQLKHISHQHPLIPFEVEVEDRKCKMCGKDIHGECFFCRPCEFYIHKSCGELPRHVRYPFHPDHCLTLGLQDDAYGRFCDGCGSEIDRQHRFIYRCDRCDYDLHLECVALKRRNIKHEAHPHFLTLLDKDSSGCRICGVKIDKGAFYARCVQCREDFHFHCGSGTASLPPTVVHEDHIHPLLRYTEDLKIKYGNCGVCKEETNQKHPVYVCVECEYYAHLLCVVTQIKLDEREKIENFSHTHFLFRVEKKMNEDVKCYACNKQIQDHPSYGCDHCRFYLHKACAELPTVIQHHLHDQHLLTLEDTLNGFRYFCRNCEFILDLDSASPQHSSIKCRAGRDIEHYSHHHPLTEVDSDTEMKCKLCDKSIYGVRYGCDSCKFHIHESCAALPPELKHPFHPLHCLTVKENELEKVPSVCVACTFKIESPGIHYRCADDYCYFRLHFGCVSLKPNVKYEGHQHLLILVENTSYRSECYACFGYIKGTFFVRCIQCKLDFHVQCGGPTSLLPPTVLNENHGHPLVLKEVCEEEIEIGKHHVSCNVCEEEIGNPEHPSYSCVECGYFAHVRCAVTEIPIYAREKLLHVSHKCVLFLLENNRNDDRKCCDCQGLIEDQSAYGCVQCEYYLHKSCGKLPLKMQHFLHRHPLKGGYHEGVGECNVCQKDLNGDYVYECDLMFCDFVLDVDCALLQLRIDFEGGDDEHILSFFEMFPHTSECQEQRPENGGTSCENCLKCKFNLYLLHSSLPRAIKIESHHHSLDLKDSHADDNYNQLVCDVCEEERDLEEGVYYCEECDFVAEFDCVVSEVIRALRENPQDEQRTINRKIADKMIRKGLTIQDMINSIPEEEMRRLNDLVAKMGWQIRGDFLRFMDIKEFTELEDWESEVENVGDYKTIPKLAGVLKSFIEKYGDIGASCTTFSQGTKSVLLFVFCAIVQNICNTAVGGSNFWDMFYSWRRNFQIIHQAGFRVDFVLDHLDRIYEASPEGVGSEFNERRYIEYLNEEMAKLSQEIMDRTQKMNKLSRQQQYIVSSIRQETQRSKAEQYCKDMENWRMLAGTRLL